MRKLILILLVAFAPALFINKANAQTPTPSAVVSDKAGWHKMAETIVNFNTDRDEIIVVGRDSYKALKLKVEDAPVHIDKMTIVYGQDQGKEEVAAADIAGDLAMNGESKVIQLKDGMNKNIQKVIFVYHSIGHDKGIETDVDVKKDNAADKTGASVKVNKKARVELWGLK